MEIRPHRWKTSHPNIPICPKRLQAVLAAGDAADQALNAPHLARAYELANPGKKLAAGGRDDIVGRRTAALRRQDRLREEARHSDVSSELAAIRDDLAQIDAELRAYDFAEDAARQALLAVTLRRNRCATYALECGLGSREVLAHADGVQQFDPSYGETLMAALAKFRKARAGVADAMTAAQAAVADLRSELAEVEDRIKALGRRPFSKAEVLAKASRDLQAHAAVGRSLLKRAAQSAATGDGANLLDAVTVASDVRAVLAAVAAPALLEAYSLEVSTRWGDDAGLTDAEREAELVTLHQARFDLELLEEKIIREAEAAGIVIERRADMHPAAILARDEGLPA